MGDLTCPVCAGSTRILIHCQCGWRSCQACPFAHPHARPGWTRLCPRGRGSAMLTAEQQRELAALQDEVDAYHRGEGKPYIVMSPELFDDLLEERVALLAVVSQMWPWLGVGTEHMNAASLEEVRRVSRVAKAILLADPGADSG